MTLDDIRQRCHIDPDTGCWHWRRAMSGGKFPRVHSPNLSKPGAPMETQPVRRAVWQFLTGQAIPKGHRVWHACGCDDCVNPKHLACGTNTEWGAHMRKSGTFKKITYTVGARKAGKARSVLTDETYAEILASNEPGVHIAKRLGVSMETVSKARRGRLRSFHPVGSPFAGLIRSTQTAEQP